MRFGCRLTDCGEGGWGGCVIGFGDLVRFG